MHQPQEPIEQDHTESRADSQKQRRLEQLSALHCPDKHCVFYKGHWIHGRSAWMRFALFHPSVLLVS